VTFLGDRRVVYPDHTTDLSSYHIYLGVNDAFMYAASPSNAWVTVEYYDEGSG
jgi:hypothetical protein